MKAISKRVGVILLGVSGAALLATGAALGTAMPAPEHTSSPAARQSSFSDALGEACNLTLTAGSPGIVADLDAPELASHLVAANSSCGDQQIIAWNTSQELEGSDLRACRFDARTTTITAVTVCVAPVELY